ncbi:MAG: hypothetical protein AAFN50_02280 [Pseudomonadota bacterium]
MKLRSALLALVALVFSIGAFAENHEEQPSLSDVWIVAPKTGMFNEFTAAMSEHMEWRAEVGDSRTWMAFVPVVGDNLNRVMFRSCCYEWADQDGYVAEAIEKGFGANFDEMVGDYVDHAHHHIDETDFENSHWTDDATGPYFGATTWYLDAGSHPEAYAARMKLSQLALDGWASDDNQWIWVMNTGGSPTLAVVSSYSSYAEMAPPEESFYEFIAEKLGSEEAANELFADFSKGKVKSDYTIWRYVPELSSVSEDE